MNIILYEPDIPQNTGSLLRLCACMQVALHIIEPCGFLLNDKRLKRVAMDYGDAVELVRHGSWRQFLEFRQGQRGKLWLLTTRAERVYTEVAFAADDMLLLGRESSGVPDEVTQAVDGSIGVPMAAGARSLNVALAASMVLGEALRQIKGFPT